MGENGRDFAKRLMDEKYGPVKWKPADAEYRQLQKYGDRNIQESAPILTPDDDGISSGANPMQIFVLWHSYADEDGRDHEMMLGVYSTRAKAEQAVDLLRGKPGFRDNPEGFEIAEGELDRTSMTEGFIRAWGDEEPEEASRF